MSLRVEIKYLDSFITLKKFSSHGNFNQVILAYHVLYWKLILSINLINLSLVKTKDISLKLEIKIEIPQDIISDKKRLDSVQQGILKAISKGPYEEGLSFKIVSAYFS